MLITFEGLDFCGKTTQARLLVEKLRHQHAVVHFLREPGGTEISERIREILLDKNHLEMTEMTELLLFSASRSQLVSDVIIPALRRGEIVVCDRYDDSTTAYQGYGRGLDRGAIQYINKIATFGTVADLTVLVDIPVEEIELRKARAGVIFDRMEDSGRVFYDRVRRGYLAMAAESSTRWMRVDGLASVEEIAGQIWNAVEVRLGSKELLRERT